LKQSGLKDNKIGNIYLNRARGIYARRDQVEKFNPDLILEHPRAGELLGEK